MKSIIGITGSIASGKTTVANLMANKKYPLISADKVVANLYKKNFFTDILIKKFKLDQNKNIKQQIKLILKKNIKNFKKLETIVHPFVRNEMKIFLKKKNNFLFLEIPLLIESKLTKYFNKIVFVDAQKKVRLRRYLKKSGTKKMIFDLLDNRQLTPAFKKKMSTYTINNNYSLAILKENVKNFRKSYE